MIPLTQIQKDKIAEYIPVFKQYLLATDREDDLNERKERSEMYSNLLSLHGIQKMTELEFGQAISSLWASLMWGNKSYLVDQLIKNNGLDQLKTSLQGLIWGQQSLAIRYDDFRRKIYGFGAGMITEILAFVHPVDCGLWNKKARDALLLLGFEKNIHGFQLSQLKGKDYVEFNNLLGEIQAELIHQGVQKLDYLGIDYFLFEVLKKSQTLPNPKEDQASNHPVPGVNDFDHDEIIDQLVALGLWLGFEVHKEKSIAAGARVDALWQAKIANLGVVTYVFEVQRRGSHDSLILNLQRAQNNPSVQRLIVIASPNDIVKIRNEVSTLSESFRRFVGYMEVTEVNRAFELMTELSEIINKLELVKSEFGSELAIK